MLKKIIYKCADKKIPYLIVCSCNFDKIEKQGKHGNAKDKAPVYQRTKPSTLAF
jgi:hypothetical protein